MNVIMFAIAGQKIFLSKIDFKRVTNKTIKLSIKQ